MRPFGGSGAASECAEMYICGHCGALETQALRHHLKILEDVGCTASM